MTVQRAARSRRGIAVSGSLLIAFLAVASAVGQDTLLKPAPNSNVSIPRAAFGKEFLLSASVIPQNEAPTSQGLAGRVVTFELFHDGVDMYESPQGQVVTTDLPARRLLATFPILGQDDQQVTIDFNQGMNRVISEGWYSTGRYRDGLSEAFEVPRSRVFGVELKQDQLQIRQAAQVRDRSLFGGNYEARVEIRYFVKPYQPSDFVSKENLDRDARYVRFFESQPQLELTTGRSSSKAARFDIRQPITIYYSANTPAEYVDAMKEGILYWNRAFGKEVIKTDKAPDGVTAPSPEHNIVQWVPWDSAGSAYADLLIDPRTGRSLHGQAYITSVFAFGGKDRARALLRNMRSILKEEKKEGAQEGEHEKHPRQLGVHFLHQEPMCACDMHEFAKQMVTGLEVMLADASGSDTSEAKILQASQDYVRNVVAHEVGHVLGLRHNFAGSLEANVTHAELEQWFNDYLTKDAVPEMKDKFTTSSVMEYSSFRAAVFNGWKIRTTQEVLPHDKAAIQWGYFDSGEPKEKKLLFATDNNVLEYGDVRTFDYGTEPVVAAFAEISTSLRYLPNSLIEEFIEARAPLDPRDQVPLESVNLNPLHRALELGFAYNSLFIWFNSNTRSLRQEKDFPFTGPLNQKDILKVRWDKLNEEVNKLGGVDRLAFSYLPVNLQLSVKDVQGVTAPEKFESAKMSARLAELLESPAYATFVGADGKTYSFTPEEKELIKARSKLFFDEFEKQLLKNVCQTLGRASRNIGVEANGTDTDDNVVAQLERQIVALGKAIILTTDESKKRTGTVAAAEITVPEFKYDTQTRMAAAQMLNDAAGSYPSWSRDARGGIHNEFKGLIDGKLNRNPMAPFPEQQLSRPLRDWFLEQQQILGMIPPSPPG